MRRSKYIAITFSIFIISLFLLNAGLSFAQSNFIVFGPKQYNKPKGHPVTYIDSFQASEGANYTLWVQSGEDGHHETRHFSISINGVEVLDIKKLKKHNPFTKKIRLQANNTIKVVLKGKEGNFITVKIFGPSSNINISVISPTHGETISKPEIMVKGNVINRAGYETGVTVNGKLANVYGSQFVANNVPLQEGANTITVTAKDTANNAATASVTVNAVKTGSYIKLSSNIDSSIVPLTAYFSASTSFIPVSYQMDFERDGVADYTGTTFENINHTYTTEGIFYPTITVTDNQGNTYSDTIAITVLSKAEIDALLKTKWEGMKGALTRGDIEGALNYFTYDSKEKYRTTFTRLQDKNQTIVNCYHNIVNRFLMLRNIITS